MDVPQLKLLAGLVRGLLEQHNVPIGHSQSLDLIAALPGLRNWPEVNAFPDRVAACVLDATSAGRLAFRLKSKHAVAYSPQGLVEALSPPTASRATTARIPVVWPSGPMPGVYVTTSSDAINALLERYEEATDGELVYAEAAGSHWDGSIDLGDHGLSSGGLARVPSGTLLIVGPLELNQQSWENSAEKLEWACMHAQMSGHRVAVLIDTPAPELMFKDIEVMVQQASPDGDDCYLALAGVVTDSGQLEMRVPFVRGIPAPVVLTSDAPLDVVPESVLPGLRRALSRRSVGVLTFGSSVLEEHRAIDLIAALLPLTADVGPVARIKPRNRGTPAKDMMVPDSVKVLPFLPSIESAYAHGYRRMLVESIYTDVDTMLKYGDEVLFFMGHYGMDATSAFLDTARNSSFNKLDKVLGKLVAAIGVGVIEVKGGFVRIGDLFVPPPSVPSLGDDYEALTAFVADNRSVRWENELARVLDSKQVTVAAVKKAFKRQHAVNDFLAARSKKLPIHEG